MATTNKSSITWYGILNIFILQWFFMRIAVTTHMEEDAEGTTIPNTSFDELAMLCWVVPLTGWFSPFWYSSKYPYLQSLVTNKKYYIHGSPKN